MDSVTLKGHPVMILEEFPAVGTKAEDIYYVKANLDEESLYDIDSKVKVVLAVPSLDTGVCQAETRKFNAELGKRKGVTGLVISKDLPFASKRFCETEGIQNIITGSDYRYGDFGREFGVEMIEGALKGLLARSVFVLDADNTIRYAELVPEILEEPNYEAALKAVDELL